MDIIEQRFLLRFESIFEKPALSVDEYLKQIPRDIAIKYGLTIANYTQDDDFSRQLDALMFNDEIKLGIHFKVASKLLHNVRFILCKPQTGLEMLRRIFSIPKDEFAKEVTQLTLIMVILKINSELLDNNARFQDKSATLFPKRIRSKFYELDDRIHVNPSIYRMFCLWFFLDTNNNDYWLKLKKELDESVEGVDCLVIEDIIDTGHTLAWLQEKLLEQKPASLRLCTLLDKPSRRETDVAVDYVGFEIPDEFVVGYGLDYAQKYRNLPYLGKLEFRNGGYS